MRIKLIPMTLAAFASLSLLTACATTDATTKEAKKPTAVEVMKTGGTYEYSKPTGPIYANSSAELAEQFVGRHVDELPEAESSTKAVQNRDEVVCKVVKRTHTRLREKKVCAPKKEWDQYKQAAQEVARTKQITRAGGDR